MRGPFVQQRRNDEQEIEKAPLLVIQKIRDAILHEQIWKVKPLHVDIG